MANRVILALALLAGVAGAVPAADDMLPRTPTIGAVRTLLQKKSIASMETFLEYLPPEYRERYNLMLATGSTTQFASPEYPRVILYGEEAKFLFAFTGARGEKGFGHAEVIEFVPDGRRFDLYTIDFTARPHAVVSDANPSRCLFCHRHSPRPNWNTYNVWPGAAGLGDSLIAFRALAGGHERYNKLVGLEMHYVPEKAELDSRGKPIRNPYHHVHPATDMSRLLAPLNGARIAELIRKSNGYAKYKYAIVGALQDCDGIEAFLPERLREGLLTPAYQDVEDETQRFAAAGPNAAFEDRKESYGVVAKLRYLLEGRLISMLDWSMNFRSTNYGFVSPEHYTIMGVLPVLARLDQDVAAYGQEVRFNVTYPKCGELQTKSLEVLR